MKEKRRILNDNIRANTVQLITDDGGNIGEMSLNQAKAKAAENGLDLMEVGRNGNITIVKMLDYGKFLYRQKKQEQKQKQKGRAPDLKTIRITFKIGENDLLIKAKQAKKFSEHGHPLKISLMLKGRENHYADIALEKIKSFVTMLEDIYKMDGDIKRSGRTFTAMLKVKPKSANSSK